MSPRWANISTASGPELPRSHFSFHQTKEILSRIRLLGRGGTIIFVPEGKAWQRSIQQPPIYDCEQRLNEMSRVASAFEKQLETVSANTADNAKTKFLLAGATFINSYEAKVLVGDAARSIAYLSAVDGATLLTKDFEVLAFGVKLKTAPSKRTVALTTILPLETDQTSPDLILEQEFRGTRHLTAAHFVLGNPGAVALVVSQDGGITGFTRFGDEGDLNQVLAYKALELQL